jgi:hypothetical protein
MEDFKMEPCWAPQFFGWMWIFPPIFLMLRLVLMYAFLFGRHACRMNRDSGANVREESAPDILDKRFTRGELTKQQHEEMKRVLMRDDVGVWTEPMFARLQCLTSLMANDAARPNWGTAARI